ncbi:hypothetical protein BC828DRAFT_388629 [Blastocladiella britannica]|nr:hypothetical protein BC828DRAFT_388629 [Blastocladiella britannica]
MAEENPGRQHAHEARISLILFALTLPICLTLLVVSYRDQHNKPISISISSILSFSPWSRRQRIASSQSNNSYGGSIGSSNNTGGALELRKATMYWTAATAIHLIEIATALCHYTDRGWDGRTPLHGSGFYNFPCPPDILWAVGQALEVVTIPVYACKLVLQLTPLAFSRTARRRRRRIERAARVYVYFTAAATISQCINLVLQHLPSFGIPVSEGFLAVTFAIDPIAYAGWEFCLVGLGLVMVYFGALALRMLRITAGRRLQSGTSGSAAEVSGSGALPADSTGTPSGGGGVVAVVNKLAAVGSQSGIAVEPTGKVSVPVQAEAKCSLSVVMLKVGFHHHPGGTPSFIFNLLFWK